ncbi:MAG: ABC transporter substrate-binding protein [Bacteroidia bacterium]|nr:ABC transporter substrate-binding protein [Bacteroidia bacterium]NNK61180.1 ABC transporter substrate-binding protein [Flavobacteriaceae bacterium]
MKKKLGLIIITLCTCFIHAQNFSNEWQGHFSYLNIVDVVEGNGKIYVASENVLFSYDIMTNDIQTITTVEGLSGDFISTILYSEAYELLIIGYESGLLEFYSDIDQEVTTVVDIIDKPTIPPDAKRINHFNEYNNLIYISTDYGISVYDLDRLEFGDTYFIGNAGEQIKVVQSEVFGDYIYAACQENNGIRRALVASDDLIDFQEWNQIFPGNYLGIEGIGERLYVARSNGSIFEFINNSFNQVGNYGSGPVDMKSANDRLVITLEDEVYIYDEAFNLLSIHGISPDYETLFTSAVSTEDEVFIGTEGFGILAANFVNPLDYVDIFPDGPLRNDAFSLQAEAGNLWVSYGDYTLSYNPAPERRYGVSHLRDEQWNNIPYDSLLNGRNLNAISINPLDPNQVFISSFGQGIVEINNDIPTIKYDQNNSGLESIVLPNNPNFVSIRVSGSTFDSNGLLWSMTCRVDRPLKSYNPSTGQWQGFDFSEVIPDGLFDELGFSDVVADNNGTKWIGALRSGVIGFNENGGNHLIKNIFDEEVANLPDPAVKSLAMDNRNQLWIGTIRGLRVLYNTSNFFDNVTIRTQPIIILEDGIPKELLQFQYISDIKVDGANNKWIATIGSGVFYFTSDGQETIFHFTKDNSPLPSNNVTDLSIDSEKGIIYIGTERGLVSFKSGSSKPQESLSDAYIYPNPVRPNFNDFDKKIKIKDISENVNIKITDIEGNLVAEAQSNTNLRYKGYNLEIDGGTAYWNGRNLANNAVASGVYLIMLSDLDTLETRVLKLMVVR